MKYSKQRELIRVAVMANQIHPTADTVYNMLHEENPNLSLATVYRNLNMLSQIGEIKKVTVPNASDHFDGTVSEHYHMVCTYCGEMTDCPISPLECFDAQIKEKTGFLVSAYQLIVYGTCSKCSQKAELDT